MGSWDSVKNINGSGEEALLAIRRKLQVGIYGDADSARDIGPFRAFANVYNWLNMYGGKFEDDNFNAIRRGIIDFRVHVR